MFNLVIVTVTKNDNWRLIETARSLKRADDRVVWLIRNGGDTFSNDLKLRLQNESEKKCFFIEGDDSGIYHAMNLAVQDSIDLGFKTEKTWLWFINSGDCVLKSLDLDEIFHVLLELDPVLVVIQEWNGGSVLASKQDENRPNTDQFRFDFLLGKHKIGHQRIIAKSEALKTFPFNENFRVASDFMQIDSLLKSQECVELPQVAIFCEPGRFSAINSLEGEQEKIRYLVRRFISQGGVTYGIILLRRSFNFLKHLARMHLFK